MGGLQAYALSTRFPECLPTCALGEYAFPEASLVPRRSSVARHRVRTNGLLCAMVFVLHQHPSMTDVPGVGSLLLPDHC